MSDDASSQKRPRRRLLVALDAAEDAQRLLDAAADMAVRMNAELAGLFVEDADLIGLGDNPLIRTVSAYTGVSGTIRRGAIEQALRRQIAEARAAFERIARARRIVATFEVRRGRLVTALESVEEATDIILVRRAAPNVQHTPASRRARVNAATRQLVMSAQRSVIVLDVGERASAHAFGRVVALYDGSPETESTLIAAADIAERRGGDGITVVPLATSDVEADELAARATQILAPYGHRPTIAARATPDIAALCAVCAAQGGVLVLHARHALLAGDAMTRLLDDIDCSVMVVR